MFRYRQFVGSGREGLKYRSSTEIWLPSTSRVGSDVNAYSGTSYPVVCSTIGRSTDRCSRLNRCSNVPRPGCRWSTGCR